MICYIFSNLVLFILELLLPANLFVTIICVFAYNLLRSLLTPTNSKHNCKNLNFTQVVSVGHSPCPEICMSAFLKIDFWSIEVPDVVFICILLEPKSNMLELIFLSVILMRVERNFVVLVGDTLV